MSRYRHQGKQVLQDGEHMADAVGEIEAMMIVNALRALEDRSATEWRNRIFGRACTVERQGDEDAYSCGKRVDAGARVGCRDCGR